MGKRSPDSMPVTVLSGLAYAEGRDKSHSAVAKALPGKGSGLSSQAEPTPEQSRFHTPCAPCTGLLSRYPGHGAGSIGFVPAKAPPGLEHGPAHLVGVKAILRSTSWGEHGQGGWQSRQLRTLSQGLNLSLRGHSHDLVLWTMLALHRGTSTTAWTCSPDVSVKALPSLPGQDSVHPTWHPTTIYAQGPHDMGY